MEKIEKKHLIRGGIELVGSWGIGTIAGMAINAIVPAGTKPGTRIAILVGGEILVISAQRIAFREFEAWCNDLDELISEIKDAIRAKKAMNESTDDIKEQLNKVMRSLEKIELDTDDEEIIENWETWKEEHLS